MSNIQSYRYVKEQENVTDDQREKIIGAELQMIQMLDLVINLKMTVNNMFLKIEEKLN